MAVLVQVFFHGAKKYSGVLEKKGEIQVSENKKGSVSSSSSRSSLSSYSDGRELFGTAGCGTAPARGALALRRCLGLDVRILML